jgi:hypothetical protein
LGPGKGRPDDADDAGAEAHHRVGQRIPAAARGADLGPEFPRREAHAMAAVLSAMFATSMTSDPAQQSDQARILNEIMSRWQPVILWQLVRRSS